MQKGRDIAGNHLLENHEKFYGINCFSPEIVSRNIDSEEKIFLDLKYKPCFNLLKNLYTTEKNLSFNLYKNGGKRSDNCLVLIHGYKGKNKKVYRQLAERFSKKGIDTLVYVLPFHFERSSDTSVIKNPQFFHIFEIYRQSIIEARIIVRFLRSLGYKKVACMGFSFGGYCCSLLACLENSLDYSVSMASLGDLGPLLGYLKNKMKLGSKDFNNTNQNRLNLILMKNHLNLICPISYKPLIDKANILFIQGLFDFRAPVKNVRKLRRRWGNPKVIWYPCDHFTFILFNRLTVRVASEFIGAK